jgi:hypothetical protein
MRCQGKASNPQQQQYTKLTQCVVLSLQAQKGGFLNDDIK